MSVLPTPARAPAAAGKKVSAAAAPPARGASLRRADGGAALRIIFAPLPEGFRHVWFGDSGQGKSTANRATIAAAINRGLIAVAHDDMKLEPQCQGAVRLSPAELEARPLTPEEDAQSAIVFRGDALTGQYVEVEEVAAFALKLVRLRIPTLLVVDELDRAVTPGGLKLESEALREACAQGRSLGLCVSSTTQSPKRAPAEILDQATTVGFFRLGPRSINYLDERLLMDDELLLVIPGLQVGEFVLHRAGAPWDRTVYKFQTST